MCYVISHILNANSRGAVVTVMVSGGSAVHSSGDSQCVSVNLNTDLHDLIAHQKQRDCNCLLCQDFHVCIIIIGIIIMIGIISSSMFVLL